ncbi:MAG: hypothetical protein KGL43_17725 [Burkholderiales bacterium]|nr:hypothetical protein [Burkholderiales bacterium]MDE2455429.1 hypothetical protein [Burkholderiales bacterium]
MPTRAKAVAFRDETIVPTLKSLGLDSGAAAELLLGTALQESKLVYRRQLGNGPARGLFQMEMATHNDLFANFLRYRSTLRHAVIQLKSAPDADAEDELTQNDAYAAAMARVHYLRAPKRLPTAGDTEAMAAYWKQYYNTPLGGGTVDQYIESWNGVMGTA